MDAAPDGFMDRGARVGRALKSSVQGPLRRVLFPLDPTSRTKQGKIPRHARNDIHRDFADL